MHILLTLILRQIKLGLYIYLLEIMSTEKIFFILVSAAGGIISNCGSKAQNSQIVYQGPFYKPFFHPYMDTMVTFLSMFISLIPFYISKKCNPEYYQREAEKAETQGKIIGIKKLLLSFPTIFQLISNLLDSIALNYVDLSVFCMLKGTKIIAVLALSKIMSQSYFDKKQKFAVLFIVLGLSLAVFCDVSFTEQQNFGPSKSLKIIGSISIVFGAIFRGLSIVFQAQLKKRFYFSPLMAVGYQGMFGFCLCLSLLPFISLIRCYFGVNACVYDGFGNGYLQKPSVYLGSFGQNPSLIFFLNMSILGGVLKMTTFFIEVNHQEQTINFFSIQFLQTVLGWILGICLNFSLGSRYPNFSWEMRDLHRNIFMLGGYTFSAIGSLIISKAIKFQWCLESSDTDQWDDHQNSIFDSQMEGEKIGDEIPENK